MGHIALKVLGRRACVSEYVSPCVSKGVSPCYIRPYMGIYIPRDPGHARAVPRVRRCACSDDRVEPHVQMVDRAIVDIVSTWLLITWSHGRRSKWYHITLTCTSTRTVGILYLLSCVRQLRSKTFPWKVWKDTWHKISTNAFSVQGTTNGYWETWRITKDIWRNIGRQEHTIPGGIYYKWFLK